MRFSALLQPSSSPDRASPRQRFAALLAALAINVLLVLMLLGLAPSPMELMVDLTPKTFSLFPERPPGPKPARVAAKVRQSRGGAPKHASTTPKPPAPAPEAPVAPLALIPLTSEEFAASDISKLPSHARAAGGAGTGTGKETGAADASADAGGGGDRLYNPDWYRKPTDAELGFYLPKRSTSGWGEIACRTIANFQVDECRELDESPAGSGLARAVREAAWQFRVLPPRIGGRPLIGAWVRIRIDYLQGAGRAR